MGSFDCLALAHSSVRSFLLGLHGALVWNTFVVVVQAYIDHLVCRVHIAVVVESSPFGMKDESDQIVFLECIFLVAD